MKVLIDTNILVSAIIGQGTPLRAYMSAVSNPNRGVVCTQNITELRRIFNRKFPHKIETLDRFLLLALQSLEVVGIPESPVAQEEQIRDLNDRDIMRAAVYAEVDVILTGDKDFLESGVKKPRIMTASEFLAQSPALSTPK